MRKAMDFIDKKNIMRFQIGQNGGQIAGTLYNRPGGGLDINTHFAGDDIGKGGFTKARRSVEQNMIQRLSPAARCFNEKAQVPLDFLLPHIVVQRPGAKCSIKLGIIIRFVRGNSTHYLYLFPEYRFASSASSLVKLRGIFKT